MRFPYAEKGVKKIFRAEILSLIATIAGGVVMVLAVIFTASANAQSEIGEGVSLTGIMLFGGAALVMLIVGAVMNVIGYIQAARDEAGFARAIICTILSIAFSVAWSLLQTQTGFLGWIATAFYAASQIATLLVTIFAIGGLMNLSARCERPVMVHKGRNVLRVLTAMYVLTLLVAVMTRLFNESDFSTALVTVMSITVTVLSVIEYILYLSYLGKCGRMLTEHNNRGKGLFR